MDQLSERDERMFSVVSHLGSFAVFLPSANVLVPLVIWLTQRHKSEYVAYHAKEALNFQITISILLAGAWLLSFISLGIPVGVMITLGSLVFGVIAAVKASENVMYEYPFNFRLIK